MFLRSKVNNANYVDVDTVFYELPYSNFSKNKTRVIPSPNNEIIEAAQILLSLSTHIVIPQKITLIFDVETTGLVNKQTLLHDYPYITQISMILFDTNEKKIIKSFNHYIKIPENIEISETITRITGITRKICDEQGISIIDALKQFYNYYCCSILLVAHNIEFDTRVIMGEFYRNRHHPEIYKHATFWNKINIFDGCKLTQHHLDFTSYFNKTIYNSKLSIESLPIPQPEIYCTMRKSINLCKIMCKKSNGSSFIKFPKLIETFQELFPKEPLPQNLHNSMIDTLVCLRCFIMMEYNEDIAKNETSKFLQYYMDELLVFPK